MMSYINMPILRCRGALTRSPAGRGLTLQASSSAVLSMPTKEVGTSRRPVGVPESRITDMGESAMPGSSGLDFIDLVDLDDYTVWNRLQDAVTYRVLVDHRNPTRPQPSRPEPHTATSSFNIKQLKLYRDNVTRNLAPTVARGFANAARAAGHVVATSQPTQPKQTPQPQSPAPAAAAAATTVAAAQPQRDQGLTSAAAPADGRASAAAHVAATAAAAASARSSSRGESPRRQQAAQHRQPTPALAAVAAAASSHSGAAVCRQTRQVAVPVAVTTRHGEQAHRIVAARSPAQTTRVVEGTEGMGLAATATAAAAQHAASRFAVAEPPPSPSAPRASGAVTLEMVGAGGASALVSGRRRGSRGAGRGPLLAAAGRQAGGAGSGGAGAGVGPAWI